MIYSSLSGWVVHFGDQRAEKEVGALAKDVRAHLERTVDLIERYGLEAMHAPHVRHLRGKFWEIRAKGKDGIARAIYIVSDGKRVIILHAFVKKTQATPQGALDLAIQRAKELGLLT